MKVRVDAELCQGHSRCYEIAPDLFDIDEIGLAHAVVDGVVPSDRQDAARLAAANCPERAIVLEEVQDPLADLQMGDRRSAE